MSDTSSITPAVVLSAGPRLLYSKWLVQLVEFLATLGVLFLGEGGLLEISFHLTDAEYALLPPVNDPAGNPIVPNVRPVFVRQEVAGTAAAIAGIKEHNNKVACVTAAFIQAKQYLIASAGDIANELHDPVTGLARVTFHALLHHIKSTYGTLLKSDIDKLRAGLRVWPSDKSVTTNLTQYAHTHLALANAGFVVLEIDKIADLDEATRSKVAIQEVFKLFRIEHPAVATQTYEALMAKIILLEPTFTAEQARYITANAAAAEASAATLQSMESRIQTALAAQEKVFLKRIDSLTAQLTKATTTGPDRGRVLSREHEAVKSSGGCVKCFVADSLSTTKWAACKAHNRNNR